MAESVNRRPVLSDVMTVPRPGRLRGQKSRNL